MKELKTLIAEKEAEVAAALNEIVRHGAQISVCTSPSTYQRTMTRALYNALAVRMTMPVGDLALMRAVPVLDKGGELSTWRLRIRWALPWWDDSDTKDHHRIEVDTWAFAPNGSPHTFAGAASGSDVAIIIYGFPFPDEDEQEIVANYKSWQEHRGKHRDKFAELDARALEYETELMHEEDARA